MTESRRVTVDTITDFLHGQDVIDLGAIDANSEVAGNQGFAFVGGAAFANLAGELRYEVGTGKLLGDIDGDGDADFQVMLTNHAALTAADLIL